MFQLNRGFNLPFLAYHVLLDAEGAYYIQTMPSCDTLTHIFRGLKKREKT